MDPSILIIIGLLAAGVGFYLFTRGKRSGDSSSGDIQPYDPFPPKEPVEQPRKAPAKKASTSKKTTKKKATKKKVAKKKTAKKSTGKKSTR